MTTIYKKLNAQEAYQSRNKEIIKRAIESDSKIREMEPSTFSLDEDKFDEIYREALEEDYYWREGNETLSEEEYRTNILSDI